MRTLALSALIAAGLSVPAMAQNSDVQPLVDANWLIEHTGEDNLVILDIRADVEGTDLGDSPYLANSVSAPYGSSGWRTTVEGLPGMIPDNQDIAELIGSLGIDNDDHVVIVPWGTNSSEVGGATRVYWSFKYLGHDAVSILDGGWRQYDAAGGARVAEPLSPEAATFEIDPQEDLLATTEEVVAALDSDVVLVDGRPRSQYTGEAQSPVTRVAGTIPGAVNLPNSQFYSEEYALFTDEEGLQALLDEQGISTDAEMIAFCNTGHWASIVWFGLSEILGVDTSMYDGSMAAWTADASRPVE